MSDGLLAALLAFELALRRGVGLLGLTLLLARLLLGLAGLLIGLASGVAGALCRDLCGGLRRGKGGGQQGRYLASGVSVLVEFDFVVAHSSTPSFFMDEASRSSRRIWSFSSASRASALADWVSVTRRLRLSSLSHLASEALICSA